MYMTYLAYVNSTYIQAHAWRCAQAAHLREDSPVGEGAQARLGRHDSADSEPPTPAVHRAVAGKPPLQLVSRHSYVLAPLRPLSPWHK